MLGIKEEKEKAKYGRAGPKVGSHWLQASEENKAPFQVSSGHCLQILAHHVQGPRMASMHCTLDLPESLERQSAACCPFVLPH